MSLARSTFFSRTFTIIVVPQWTRLSGSHWAVLDEQPRKRRCCWVLGPGGYQGQLIDRCESASLGNTCSIP